MPVRTGPGRVFVTLARDVYDRAAGNPGPVTVVHGDADETVPLDHGRRYAELYGDRASLTVLPGGDHDFATVALRERLLEVILAGITRA